MGQKAPACRDCDYCSHQATNGSYSRYEYCHHPVWRIFRSTGGKRWIPSRERGKTSPSWCPLRREKSAKDTNVPSKTATDINVGSKNE